SESRQERYLDDEGRRFGSGGCDNRERARSEPQRAACDEADTEEADQQAEPAAKPETLAEEKARDQRREQRCGRDQQARDAGGDAALTVVEAKVVDHEEEESCADDPEPVSGARSSWAAE